MGNFAGLKKLLAGKSGDSFLRCLLSSSIQSFV